MTINEMRMWLINYPKYKGSLKWRQKVMNMHPNQVIAIYHKLLSKPQPKREPESESYHQMDLFEWAIMNSQVGNTTQVTV